MTDRNQMLSKMALLSAEEYADFLRDLRVERLTALRPQLQSMSTPELQTRAQFLLLNRSREVMERQRELAQKQLEHVQWINRLGDETDAADVDYVTEIASEGDRMADMYDVYTSELTVIARILEERGANVRDAEGDA